MGARLFVVAAAVALSACSSSGGNPDLGLRDAVAPGEGGVDAPPPDVAPADLAPDVADDGGTDTTGPPCDTDKVKVYQSRLDEPTSGAITLVLGVETCADDPVVGLEAKDFSLLEDGKALPAGAELTLLQRHAEVYVSLLIDTSPSLQKAGAVVKAVIAAKALVDKVMTDGVWISVSHFSETAKLVQPFTRDKAAVHAALEAVAEVSGGSEAIDLYGTLIGAIEASTIHRAAREGAMRRGVFTLGQVLLFTDGTDQAAVKTLAEAEAAVATADEDVVTIGFGLEIDDKALAALGTRGAFVAQSVGDLKTAFADAGARLKLLKQRLYYLGYCSTLSGAGHTLEVAVAAGKSSPIPVDATDFVAGSCSASAFADACEGINCGGLLCGGCSADLWCSGNGLCTKCDSADVCKIDEQCLKVGYINPQDACQRCDPAHAKDAWKTDPGDSCGDQCVDLQTDPTNCGSCGRSCKGNPCVAGQCTALTLSAASSAASSLAISGGHAYWTDGGEVKKVVITGGTPTVLASGEDNPREVLVVSGAVVWIADKSTKRCVRSLPPGGSAVMSLYCEAFAPALASDGSSIKVVWGTQIGTLGPAGGISFAQASVFASVQVVDLLHQNGLLYWVDGAGAVGTEQKVLSTSSAQGIALTVVGGKIYWSRIDAGALMNGEILTQASGGTGSTVVASGQHALSLTTDGQAIYWANTVAGGSVVKLDLAAGTAPASLVTGEPSPRAVVAAGDHVYWLSDAAVKRVAK